MIETKVKIHDKYSFEFKIAFITDQEERYEDTNEFSINTWLFVPNSLDINHSTYSKSEFYKDVKSNVRLITPVFTLKEIYRKDTGLTSQLNKIFKELSFDPANNEKTENFNYHVRMFMCICKSAIRDRAYYIRDNTNQQIIPQLIEEYIDDVRRITQEYRKLRAIINSSSVSHEQHEVYKFGDDFLGNVIEQQTFRIIRGLKSRNIPSEKFQDLVVLLEEEIKYKKHKHYSVINPDDPTNNYLVIMRRGILKKFIESDLYLNTKQTKDGAFAEQFYYGIAAGIAMVFATIVTFTAQIRYGNFTVPLFFALVIGYMFKDRIKDLMRYYFSTQLGKKYYDNKRELEIRKQKIGFTKEAFDFVTEDKVPTEVMNLRKRSPLVEAENKIYTEKILLYKKLVTLSSRKLNQDIHYKFIGINDITRFNIMPLILKMDDPLVPLYLPDKDTGYIEFEGEKVYLLHFILRCESKDNLYYRKFRLLFNRTGIKEIKEIKEY